MKTEQKRILIFDEDYERMRDFKEYLEEEFGWFVELTAQKEIPHRLQTETFDLILIDSMIHLTSFDADNNEVENVHFDDVNWQKTGLEFAKRLRGGEFSSAEGKGTSPLVPVIILSAVANYSIKPDLENMGFLYQEKPFLLDEMTEQIKTLLKV